MTTTSTPPPPVPSLVVDRVTILSLLSTVLVLLTAYLLSQRLLPASASRKTRILFVWHAFDALIHFVFEGSFLYNCFFAYHSVPLGGGKGGWAYGVPLTPPDVWFLGHRERMYGASYGTSVFSRLWQEYAKADRRWGGADLTVVSLEILTVGVGGPLALAVCGLLVAGQGDGDRRGVSGKAWFWMVVLATGELYGGFMTFAPEWLSGSPNLDTSNFMYKWVYLFFFNTLWVWLPLWVLYEAYGAITGREQQVPTVSSNLVGKKTA